MSTCIDHLRTWFRNHPKAQQWAWFAALWLGGLLTVVVATYPIKLLIKMAS